MNLMPGIFYSVFEDKVYVHNVDNQNDYIFNEIVFDILDYCKKNRNCSIEDICKNLDKIYEVSDAADFQNDIQEFLDELLNEKILYENETPYIEAQWSNKIPMEVANIFAQEHKIFSVSIELTYRCVEKCIHCYIDDAPKYCAADELTLDEYKNFLKQLREMGCVNVLFTGGEILLRPDLCDIVEYAVNLGFIVNLYTTGVGLTDEVFDKLCATKINGISVSLYSGIAAEHDKITGVKGSFEKTLKATLMFKAAGINTFIKCVAMKQNLDSLESLYELGKRLNIFVTVSPRIISGHEGKNSADYSLGSVELYKKFYKLSSQYVTADKTAPKFSREQMLEKSACGAGINALSIDPFGNVRPCNTFQKILGSLRKESLKNIWERAQNLKLKNCKMRYVTPNCTNCEYLEYCTVCVADLINKNHGDFGKCGESLIMAKAAAEMLS